MPEAGAGSGSPSPSSMHGHVGAAGHTEVPRCPFRSGTKSGVSQPCRLLGDAGLVAMELVAMFLASVPLGGRGHQDEQ